MKNNKGFTIIELGVSICLVTVVSFLLFQLVSSVKSIYTKDDIQTTLLTKQAIMIKKIQDDLLNSLPNSITYCKDHLSNSCLMFTFSDGTTKELMVNPIEKKILYDDYLIDYYDIDNTVAFGDLTFNSSNDYFSIKIPIISKMNSKEKDYGIYITKQASTIYNLGVLGDLSVPTVNGTIPIKNDNDDTWMVIYEKSATWLQDYFEKYMKNLKINECSNNNSTFSNKIYEFKTDTSRWCQDTNFYSQKVANYQYVSGYNVGALDKDNFAKTIETSLNTNTVYIKLNEYMDKYTFKARV